MVTYTRTLNSEYYLWPAESQIGIICTGRITDQIVDDFGVNVKLREVYKSDYNVYGDATKTNTDSYTKAYLHRWTITDDEVKEGIYKNGQIMFVFKITDEAKIKTGNMIFYDKEWYQIRRIEKQVLAGITYFINASVEKAQ